jgi:DNA adenine methylase
MDNKPTFKFPSEPYTRSKGYVKSPFRYPGGKFYALAYILPFISCVPHDEYREPFIGGGSVFFAKPKVSYNWINDLETNLIQTYRVISNPELRQDLINFLDQEIATRERHAEIKELNTTSLLDLAFKTYYLNRTSYSGIIHKPAWGYKEGKSSPPQNWGAFLENAGKKLADVQITDQDFEDVINAKAQGDNVLMYLDPPYFHADQKRAYTKSFSLEDHERLATVLAETNYLFCLSYDDCEEIRDLYSWAEIYERSWLYNTANVNGGARKVGQELIITNYCVTVNEPTQLSFFD